MSVRKLSELKIAVVHDHLGWKGGGERTSLLLADALGADYITAYADPDTYPDRQSALGPRMNALAIRPVKLRGLRFFWLRWLFWRHRKLLGRYDILIASGQPAIEAVAAYARKGASRIVYNHTPPRRVFDLYGVSKRRYPPVLRPFFALFIRYWKALYLHALDRMDFDICNSETVRARVLAHTGRDANAVIRPPILTDKFKHLGDGDYFLSWARLDEAKRVELVVEAFTKMPDEKLIVASDGMMLNECKRIAAGHRNIEFVGALNDDELVKLVGWCRAAVYIPKDEDAGMTHLEANSAGKPVLAVEEGGVGETVIEGATGVKIKADPAVEDVISGVKRMNKEWCVSRKESCRAHAQDFSYAKFAEKIIKAVELNNPDLPVIGIDASRWEDPRHPGEGKRSGVEIYSWHLLESLYTYLKGQPCRPRFYAPRIIPSLPISAQKIVPPRRFWTLFGLSAELSHNPPQAFFTPSYLIPPSAPNKSVAVIHDIAFEAAPHRYGALDWLHQHMAWSANKTRSSHLVAVSRSTMDDIIKRHPRIAAKTVFVPPGYASHPLFRSAEKKSQTVAYVGRIDRKKSVDTLIRAFIAAADRLPGWRLELAGADGLGSTDIKGLARGSAAKDRIAFRGFIPEEEKAIFMSESAIFVQPSPAEGSALSLLEAWDAGTAAIVADIAVMHEIGGQAVRYFKPEDPDDLARNIVALAEDVNGRFYLAVAGREELSGYSWKKTAARIGDLLLPE